MESIIEQTLYVDRSEERKSPAVCAVYAAGACTGPGCGACAASGGRGYDTAADEWAV